MDRAEYKRQWRQKNKEKLQAYNRAYREANSETLIAKDKERYELNKTELLADKREKYAANNEQRKSARQRAKKDYEINKEIRLVSHRTRFLEGKKLINEIALHYGCQNPTCKWLGEFFPPQLEFHHKDRKTKLYNISSMGAMKLEVIAAEINKCCVLCACCHAAVERGFVTLPDGLTCSVNEQLRWD